MADAKQVVAGQVMASMSSYPSREALLSALECGSYETKFGKRRGKKLTLLNDQLPLEQHHEMILREANNELRKTFLELVQDDLQEKELFRIEGDAPVAVSFESIEALPEIYQIDVLTHFKASESALKKHAKELNKSQGFLAREQLTEAQLSKLGAISIPEDDDSDADEDEADDKD